MKRIISSLLFAGSLFYIILYLPPVALSSDGNSSCGYIMKVIPVQRTPAMGGPLNAPAILDAWTTNDPLGNPYSEVYDFATGQDIMGFVVEYNHTGGFLPEQWAKGWICGTEIPVKICNFKWTIGYLPPGVYLLINYFDPVEFPIGNYDWASKVGNVVFGWPNINASRPWCFKVH